LLSLIPTEWENKKIDRPEKSKWASVHFLPNTPEPETLGDAGEDYADGILQINFFYPPDSGTKALRADYEAIRAVFHAGAQFATEGGKEVAVRSCGQNRGGIDGPWFAASVSIEWYGLIER
jgi:hypothetical protein